MSRLADSPFSLRVRQIKISSLISSLCSLPLCALIVLIGMSHESPIWAQGLTADYYSGRNFNTLERSESNIGISADWDREGPYEGGPRDNFSIRWRGQITAPQSGVYQFRADYDDGYRLWVGEQLIINAWSGGPAILIGEISLDAARVTPITVEFFEQGGVARALLSWRLKDSGDDFTPIPLSALSPLNEGSQLPRVGLSVRDARGLEGNDPARFTVYRLGRLDEMLTVELVFTGNAEEGLDYVNPPREINFEAGIQAKDFEIFRSDDDLARGPKLLDIGVVYSESYTMLSNHEITLTLLDDERSDDLEGERFTIAGVVSGLDRSSPVVIQASGPEVRTETRLANGSFSFPPVLAGDYTLIAWLDDNEDGLLSAEEERAELRVAGEMSTYELSITLPPHLLSIEAHFTPSQQGTEEEIAGEMLEINGGEVVEMNAGEFAGQNSAGDMVANGGVETRSNDEDMKSTNDSEGCQQESHSLHSPLVIFCLLFIMTSIRRDHPKDVKGPFKRRISLG